MNDVSTAREWLDLSGHGMTMKVLMGDGGRSYLVISPTGEAPGPASETVRALGFTEAGTSGKLVKSVSIADSYLADERVTSREYREAFPSGEVVAFDPAVHVVEWAPRSYPAP